MFRKSNWDLPGQVLSASVIRGFANRHTIKPPHSRPNMWCRRCLGDFARPHTSVHPRHTLSTTPRHISTKLIAANPSLPIELPILSKLGRRHREKLHLLRVTDTCEARPPNVRIVGEVVNQVFRLRNLLQIARSPDPSLQRRRDRHSCSLLSAKGLSIARFDRRSVVGGGPRLSSLGKVVSSATRQGCQTPIVVMGKGWRAGKSMGKARWDSGGFKCFARKTKGWAREAEASVG